MIDAVMKLISWNMNRRDGNWMVLADLMREHDAIAAMVQEAVGPPTDILDHFRVFADPFEYTRTHDGIKPAWMRALRPKSVSEHESASL